jgi:hypothetical protein
LPLGLGMARAVKSAATEKGNYSAPTVAVLADGML